MSIRTNDFAKININHSMIIKRSGMGKSVNFSINWLIIREAWFNNQVYLSDSSIIVRHCYKQKGKDSNTRSSLKLIRHDKERVISNYKTDLIWRLDQLNRKMSGCNSEPSRFYYFIPAETIVTIWEIIKSLEVRIGIKDMEIKAADNTVARYNQLQTHLKRFGKPTKSRKAK